MCLRLRGRAGEPISSESTYREVIGRKPDMAYEKLGKVGRHTERRIQRGAEEESFLKGKHMRHLSMRH